GAVEEDLLVRQGEAALEGVVIAALEPRHVGARRPAGVDEAVEGDVHVGAPAPEERDRLRRRPGRRGGGRRRRGLGRRRGRRGGRGDRGRRRRARARARRRRDLFGGQLF